MSEATQKESGSAAVAQAATSDPGGVEQLERLHSVIRDQMAAALEALQGPLATVLDMGRSQMQGLSQLKRGLESDVEGELWNSALEELCRRAARAFPHPAGIERDISAADVADALGVESYPGHYHLAKPLPSIREVWSYLERTYGSDSAATDLERELVGEFVDFWLRIGYNKGELKEPVWRRDSLVLTERVYAEKRWDGKGHELEFHSRQSLQRGFGALANVLRIVGHTRAAYDTLEVFKEFAAHNSRLESRRRYPFANGCRVITYLQKVEVELAGDVARDLLARVAEHIRWEKESRKAA